MDLVNSNFYYSNFFSGPVARTILRKILSLLFEYLRNRWPFYSNSNYWESLNTEQYLNSYPVYFDWMNIIYLSTRIQTSSAYIKQFNLKTKSLKPLEPFVFTREALPPIELVYLCQGFNTSTAGALFINRKYDPLECLTFRCSCCLNLASNTLKLYPNRCRISCKFQKV